MVDRLGTSGMATKSKKQTSKGKEKSSMANFRSKSAKLSDLQGLEDKFVGAFNSKFENLDVSSRDFRVSFPQTISQTPFSGGQF